MRATRAIEAIAAHLGTSREAVIDLIREQYMEQEALTLDTIKDHSRDDGVLSPLEKFELGVE